MRGHVCFRDVLSEGSDRGMRFFTGDVEKDSCLGMGGSQLLEKVQEQIGSVERDVPVQSEVKCIGGEHRGVLLEKSFHVFWKGRVLKVTGFGREERRDDMYFFWVELEGLCRKSGDGGIDGDDGGQPAHRRSHPCGAEAARGIQLSGESLSMECEDDRSSHSCTDSEEGGVENASEMDVREIAATGAAIASPGREQVFSWKLWIVVHGFVSTRLEACGEACQMHADPSQRGRHGSDKVHFHRGAA
jgi:hypothetical protein